MILRVSWLHTDTSFVSLNRAKPDILPEPFVAGRAVVLVGPLEVDPGAACPVISRLSVDG